MTREQARATFPNKPDPWYDGYVNGEADKRLGICLDVAIYPDGSDYSRDYTRGYRAANH